MRSRSSNPTVTSPYCLGRLRPSCERLGEQMDDRALKRQCELRVKGLTLPVPFELRAFCDRVAASRGRPIELRPVVTDAGPWGLWAASDSTDYIFYESDTSPLHQEHIVLHEVSHLICGHRPVPATEEDLLGELFPDLSPDTVRRVLGRITYSRAEEREAEMLASVILERISARRPRGAPPVPALGAREAEVIDRLASTLRADLDRADLEDA